MAVTPLLHHGQREQSFFCESHWYLEVRWTLRLEVSKVQIVLHDGVPDSVQHQHDEHL